MSDFAISLNDWTSKSVQSQFDDLKHKKDSNGDIIKSTWRNIEAKFSPVKLYSYLTLKYGPPNGIITLMNNKSTDNLTHWHYVLESNYAIVNFLGMASGIEIFSVSKPEYYFSNLQLEQLINLIIEDINVNKRDVRNVNSNFEHWKLFINPFARVEQALQGYLDELESLDLTEPPIFQQGRDNNLEDKKESIGIWSQKVRKAASLGMTIRMLCPVMLESFLNLVLLIFRKDEFKSDKRLYDSMIRQQIDIRVKTLHLHCTCFENRIDDKSEAFKKMHSLMNRRNEIVHGTIDPISLVIEDVWFDQSIIPLFEKDESIIRKTIKNYCTNVEPDKAFEDFQIVSDFIELTLTSMTDSSCVALVRLMSDDMPGLNMKSQEIGFLFNSSAVVEGYFY